MAEPVLGNTAIGDVFLVTFDGRLSNQRILNTFHYEVITSPDVPTDRWDSYDEIYAQVASPGALAEKFLAFTASNYELKYIQIQCVAPVRKIFRRYTMNTPGTRAGNAPAPNLALSIERRGDSATRRGVGRLQVPGLLATDIVNGLIQAPAFILASAIKDQLLLAVPVGGTTGFADPTLYGITPGGSYHKTLIIGADVKDTVRTMSRRTVGRGE